MEEIVWEGADLVGEWTLSTSLMGNDLSLACTFTQDGPTLGGGCVGPPPLGEVPIEGSIDGIDVSFKFTANVGPGMVLLHQGTLNADATVIEGTLDLMWSVSEFTMERQ